MIVLIGRSSSGKSSIQKKLDEKGYPKIVMTTTRDKRSNEVEGIDYYFISEEEWAKRSYGNRFVDSAVYNNWRYGLEVPENSENMVACVTPAGFRRLKKLGYDTYSVYIKVDEREALIRCLLRGDDIVEACRRSLTDKGQFDRVDEEVDLVIENDFKKSIEELATEVLKGFQSRKA